MMRSQGGQASCCTRAALLPLLLLAVACASLARPAAAASIISTACPTGNNVVNVQANSDLAEVFYTTGNGAGKTYVLQRGRAYTLSSQISIDGNRVGATSSVTCFIGGGDNRGDVVVTATAGIPANNAAFSLSSNSAGAAITLGVKGLTLNNGVNAAGFEFRGAKVGWSIQDVTVRGGTGGLFSVDTSKGDLDNVAFEHIVGQGVDIGTYGAPLAIYPLTPSTATYQWRDLVVVGCTNTNGFGLAVLFISSGAHVTMSGRVYMAHNQGTGFYAFGGALWVEAAFVDFSGHVAFEGNQVVGGLGGAAFIRTGSVVRFTESSTLLVKGNHALIGGGFFIRGSTVLMLGTTRFIGNTADSLGGAVYATFSNTQVVFNAVCISRNTAGDSGSGIYLDATAQVTFNVPALAQMADNRPADSSISVLDNTASWTCSGSGSARSTGNYDINGPICACGGPPYTCSCPDPSPGACACGVCEPGSGPCCTDAAQLAPCTRSIQLATYMQGSSEHYSSRQHYSAKHSASAVTVELAASVWDTGAQGSSAPAVNVPVSFAVHGDCAPDVAARSSITDAQGRAHARVTFSRPPGDVAVVAAVRSGGSLPSRVVTAVRRLNGGRDDATGYGVPEDDDEQPRRSSYKRDGDDHHTRRYGADHADAREAYEAVATQMVLQALEEGQGAAQAFVSGASV